MLSIDGLVTGIDTESVINGVLEIQQQQIDRLNTRKEGIVEQQTAVGFLESTIASLQSSIVQLGRVGSNAFSGRLSSVSDESAIAVAVSNAAPPGSYRLSVNSLARAHQVASNGLDSVDSEIATGEYSLQVGAGEQIVVEVDTSNNTLSGLADSINAANADVAATVINDGSSSSAHRLLLTSNKTGASNELTIAFVQDPSSTDPAVAFDMGNPVQAAANATVQLGSGAGAILITNETNQLDEVIPGVTLDLLKADDTTELSIDITRDVEKAKNGTNDFVSAYNGFITFVNQQSKFDPDSGAASVLFSNRSVDSIKDEITRVVTSIVPGIDRGNNRLAAAGITIDEKGLLQVDNSKLDELATSSEGLNKLSELFGLSGTSSNHAVKFVLAGSDTKASPLDENGDLVPYQVRVLKAAERARIVGTNAVQAVTIDESNNSITLEVDKSSEVELTLVNGDYTPEELANHLESLINEDDGLRGRSVSATLEDGKLELTSENYGSTSSLTIVSGTAVSALGFVGGETRSGFDVLGEFVFNAGTPDEYSERGEGRGQVLIGRADDDAGIEEHKTAGDTEGLQLRITLTPSQVDENELIDVSFTRGIASKLSGTIDSILHQETGKLKQMNDAFNARIESVDDSIERLNRAFDARRESLATQFARLESLVGDLQGIGGLLSTQLASIPQL